MLRLVIINGPNLNLLGKREPEIYGHQSFESFFEELKIKFPGLDLNYFQSNHEGHLIDLIQKEGFTSNGLIINAGGFSHTSIALADAVASVPAKAIEVHISNVANRETFRQHSFLAPVCMGSIVGLGLSGYGLAIQKFIEIIHL